MTLMMMSQFPDVSLTISQNLKILTAAAFKEHKDEYRSIINVQSTDLNIEKMMRYEGPGTAPEKLEGRTATQTRLYEGNIETIRQSVFSFELPVSWEQRKYATSSSRFISQLGAYNARSQKLRTEYQSINVINNGFSSSYAGYDGAAYFSASHTWRSGGTYSNLLSSAVLGKDTLETALIAIADAKMEKSIPAALRAGQVTIGSANIFVLPELTKSIRDPETNNNAYNVFQDFGLTKNINHYISSTNDYVIDTDVKTRTLFVSQKVEFTSYYDNPTKNLVENSMSAMGAGFHDQLGSFASQGGS
jgi:hypothetical protein